MGNRCQRSAWQETFLGVLIVALSMTGAALGQSTSPATPQSQTTSPSPSSPQAQPQTQPSPESVADAARKAKTDKGKSKARKVYTDEDLPTGGHSISVVGEEHAAGDTSRPAKNSGAKSGASEAAKQEQFWRGRARRIRDQMDAADREIAALKEDIKKNGAGGFDTSSGLQKNVIYVNDKNGQVTQLEKRKSELEKEMDQLMEEGRKAGASPSWFR
jgi:chaperonin cofactor prefoldin